MQRNNCKGQVHLFALLVIAVVAIGLFAVFTAQGEEGGREAIPDVSPELTALYLEEALCMPKCPGESYTEDERLKCNEVPYEESELTCGEIFTKIKEIHDEQEASGGGSTGTSTTEYYALKGEFQPCSTMTLTLKEDIVNPSMKIKPKTGDDTEAIAIRDKDGVSLILVDDYYKLCDGICSDVEFQLPCEKKAELEKFKPEIYEISFNVEEVKPITKRWTCVNDASFPEGINFNQMGTKDITKVNFKKEVKSALSSHMKADVQIIFGGSGGGCRHPETGVIIADCRIASSHDLGLKYNEGDSYYHFTMPKINGELKEILFNILIEAEGSDVGVCTARVSASMRCTNLEKYLCYGETDDDGKYWEYILSSRSDDGEYTLDGVCKYSLKTEYETGCVNILTHVVTDEPEGACHLPEKVYREGTIIENEGTHECSAPPDISIVDIHPCKAVEDCDENTIFSSMDVGLRYINVKIRNNGAEAISFDGENLYVTINGNEETVHVNEVTIDPSETVDISDITTDGLSAGSFDKSELNTVKVRIDNIDTAIYPVINEKQREDNNIKEETIIIYRQCCGDCVSCHSKTICGECSGICEWELDEQKSEYGCIKK